jgi:glycerol uptake facilitator-like aquaporin
MGLVLIIAQIVGSILGFGLLRYLTPEEIFWAPEQGTCMTLVNPKVSITQAFFIEFFLTSALISLVCRKF